jgi:hypothetical protein
MIVLLGKFIFIINKLFAVAVFEVLTRFLAKLAKVVLHKLP